MPVKLLTSGGGGVNLVPSSSIASDQTMYLPTSGTSGGTVLCTDSTGGTANGVLYLNGSKQVTSGSGLVFDSSGNLLVGKTSAGSTANAVWMSPSTSTIRFNNTTASGKEWSIGSSSPGVSGAGDYLSFARYSGSAWAEYARIDSSGNLLVGTTSLEASGGASVGAYDKGGYFKGGKNVLYVNCTNNANSYEPLGLIRQNSTGNYVAFWYGLTTQTGTITTNGTTTSYNTSSDYRLKEDYQPVADAIARLNQLKPINFAWKMNGERCDGFLAHELQEVIPEAATGTKDEVDAEGNPKYQGIDQSKIVPLLTAALQEAVAKIESQAQTIESLIQRIEALEYTKQGE